MEIILVVFLAVFLGIVLFMVIRKIRDDKKFVETVRKLADQQVADQRHTFEAPPKIVERRVYPDPPQSRAEDRRRRAQESIRRAQSDGSSDD